MKDPLTLLKLVSFAVLLSADCLAGPGADQRIDLSGEWSFRLDPDDQGGAERWHLQTMHQTVSLPGCLQEQGHGNIPGPETLWWNQDRPNTTENKPWMEPYRTEENFKTQEFLLPARHYIGAAWYAREFEVPDSWSGKRARLLLERCHWESKLWLNGIEIGSNRSLATPHVYELGVVEPGKHRLVLRIDNSEVVKLGANAHSVSEQTAGTWNGVVGKIELQADDPIWIDHIQVSPFEMEGEVPIKVRIGNATGRQADITCKIDAAGIGDHNPHDPAPVVRSLQINSDRHTELTLYYQMGPGIKRWDEFHPHRYRMVLKLEGEIYSDTASQEFGIRDFGVEGRQFSMNGRRTFLRGNTDCAVMPKTGYAPMDVTSWRKVWKTYKDFGLNMARFHSWCPPEAAFQAADEIGIYLAPEVGEWAKIREAPQKEFLRKESKRILKTYGHHPSFVILGLGNEFGGHTDYFEQLIDEWKQTDPDRIYTIKANSERNPDNIDFEALLGMGARRSIKLRYQGVWPPMPKGSEFNTRAPQTSIDWRAAVQSTDMPLVQHETAQFCAYPNIPQELPKFTGYLKASYLEIAREQLKKRGMLDLVPAFVEASGRWQVELTREEFEAGFRTPELAGFHWLSLADFTGQTTAPVGFTDAFYDPKSHVDPAQIRRWNAPTVLLARMHKRIFTQEDTFMAGIEVTHYGPDQLVLNDLRATLRDDSGRTIKEWQLPGATLGQGSAQPLGNIQLPMGSIEAPARLNLELASADNALANDWNLWIFANDPALDFPTSIRVAHQWNSQTKAWLDKGETVLLLPQQGALKGDLPSCFTTFYWTSFGTKGGQSSACGLLLEPKSHLFDHFPTAAHTDWQWWDLLTRCQPMILDSYDSRHAWPKDYRPLVQPIDSWKINRKLALVAEARVGSGKLLICSIDLKTDLANRPATRQFRKSLILYMLSDEFKPTHEVTEASIMEIFDSDAPVIEENSKSLPADG